MTDNIIAKLHRDKIILRWREFQVNPYLTQWWIYLQCTCGHTKWYANKEAAMKMAEHHAKRAHSYR